VSTITFLISVAILRWPLNCLNEIVHACGRELPPVMIYHAPTIASLAALLEGSPEMRFPPLVLLKPGTEKPPIFVTHGLGGSVIDFYQVVKHIQLPHPIYGMQAKGIDGVEEPFERIEDMAQFYLHAVKELQPCGPYLLVGFSLGGLVTLEMAQRLRESGERVALLAMLDSYPHIRYLSLGQRLRLTTSLLERRLSAVVKLGMRGAFLTFFAPHNVRCSSLQIVTSHPMAYCFPQPCSVCVMPLILR
jgi:acetoacetyl-CoA synthetase